MGIYGWQQNILHTDLYKTQSQRNYVHFKDSEFAVKQTCFRKTLHSSYTTTYGFWLSNGTTTTNSNESSYCENVNESRARLAN